LDTSTSFTTKSLLKDAFFIILGIFTAAFGLESFLLPNSFIDGGATGISLLLTTMSSLPLYVLIIRGFFLGAGIGLSIRGGSVLDGTEVLAIFLSSLILKFQKLTQKLL